MGTTDRCANPNCGLVFENSHATCQGHQWCYPECPKCGSDLVPDPTNVVGPVGGQR